MARRWRRGALRFCAAAALGAVFACVVLAGVADAAGPSRSARGGTLVAPPASFSNDVCKGSRPTGASYLIPTSVGVTYSVNGKTMPPGTYPASDGSTVRVVGHAGPGTRLVGITQWTYTFPPRPACGRGSGHAGSGHPGGSGGSGGSGGAGTGNGTSAGGGKSGGTGTGTGFSRARAGVVTHSADRGGTRLPSSNKTAGAAAGSTRGSRGHGLLPAYTGVTPLPALLVGGGLLLLGVACLLAATGGPPAGKSPGRAGRGAFDRSPKVIPAGLLAAAEQRRSSGAP